MKIKNKFQKYHFIEIFKFKGVPIMFHWSTLVIVLLIFITSISNTTFPISLMYWLIILIGHELGHMWFASRLDLKSTKIEIYPIGGLCYSEEAQTEYENALVAWGGIIVQAMIFIPVFILSFIVNNPSYELKELFYYLGTLNLIIALINLVPIPPLDGAKAWKWIPLYLQYGKIKKHK